MASLIVPNNLDDTTVLKRFLTQLVTGLGSNPFYTGNVEQQNQAIIELLQNNPTLDFFNTVSQINELRSNILTYVEDNVETIVKQNTKDIALIAEQFGTFSEQALAASWYGLSVKAGGAVAGLEVGSLDPDITTPGDESSYFRIIADNFILGRAYEDLTQEEKNYLAANNLPSFGTVYNASKQPIPALITSWDSANQVYKHYFNGIVQFGNIQNVPTINKTYIQATAPTTSMVLGDTWLNTSASYASYTYNGSSWISTGNKTYIQTSQPTFGCVVGDIWIDSDDSNKSYRYDGSFWVDTTINPATIINNGTTTINGGKITTNTVEANVLKPSTGGTTVWSGGGLVSQNFNGNSVGSIGTPTQGFRLSSDAIGTSDDPNIYGAYIKGATLEGTALNVSDIKVKAVSYPNNFGPVMFSEKKFDSVWGATITVISSTLYSAGYSTGYNDTRLCNNSVQVKLSATMFGLYSVINYLTLYVSTDNGSTWVTLSSASTITNNGFVGISYTYAANSSTNVLFKAVGTNQYSNAPMTISLELYYINS